GLPVPGGVVCRARHQPGPRSTRARGPRMSRAVVAIEFLSVDGVMQGLGSRDEDREGGFEHGGWGAPYAEAVHAATGAGGLGSTTAYLFGRKTYEKMASY